MVPRRAGRPYVGRPNASRRRSSQKLEGVREAVPCNLQRTAVPRLRLLMSCPLWASEAD